MKPIRLFLFLLFFQMSFSAQAQLVAPKYSNEFLAIGVGARAAGMGNAQVAVTNDVTAGYWNPAGLASIKSQYQAAYMHAEYFAGIVGYDYAGFATRFDQQTYLGLSIIRMGVDNIPDTRFLVEPDGNINYQNVNAFSEASYAFLVSAARKFSLPTYPQFKNVQIGATFKVIRRTAGVFANAWGFGIDLGGQMEWKKWRIGVMGRDLIGTFNIWQYNTESFVDVFSATGNRIPQNYTEVTLPRIIIDIARQIQFSEKLGLLITAGLNNTFDGKRNTLLKTSLLSADVQGGFELNYQEKVYIRAGVSNFQRLEDFNQQTYTSTQPSFGLGFRYQNFLLDYALTNIGRQPIAMYSHVFTLKADFENKKKKK